MSPEVQKIVPALKTLYFYLTEGCNLRCRHCWLAPQHEEGALKYPYLDFTWFCDVIRQAKPLGLSGVKLTGGEPLMHPGIGDIVDHIFRQKLSLAVETNGVLCTEELAQKLAKINNILVSVSLDGPDAQTHEWVRGVQGSFAAAVQGIKNLIGAGIRVQVIMSVMRHTRDKMAEMVRLAASLGVAAVKFNVVMPAGRGKKIHEQREVLTIRELLETGAWVENELAPQAGIRVFYDHPPAFRPLGKLYGESGDGCSSCGILGILGVLANGNYALCGIGTSVPELVFGNVQTDRLSDVWQHAPVLKEIREGLPKRLEGVCQKCVMKQICGGRCLAQHYYTRRNLWASFWYCHEAYKAGLFPENRLRPGNRAIHGL